MELTGKALEDFNTWFRSKRANPAFRWWMLSSMDSTVVNLVVIEFFDSVGIYISVFVEQNCSPIEFELYVDHHWVGSRKTRQEATKEAIKEANEIYNSLA